MCIIMKTLWDVPQHILDSDGTVVVPVDYQCTLRMEGTRCVPLEPYLWRQHSSAISSPSLRQLHPDNVGVERWAAGGRCQFWRMLLLASPVVADIIMNLFVLCQVCLVAATNGCFQIQARPQGADGPAGRRQEQRSCTHNMNIIENVWW